jgi:hypothetical protein
MILLLILFHFFQSENIPEFNAVQKNDSDYIGYIDDELEVLPGCSWYCGGSVEGFNASSSLDSNKMFNYIPKNAHDFNINTTWIEGKVDYGIGEYLEYIFDTSEKGNHKLGITQIILSNGYKKNKELWNNNSRVKKLKVYVNNKLHCLINLIDCYEFQVVNIDTIMLPINGIMKLKFEIVDVYPGNKYKDTAITELLFNGIGVH